jgi:hypothetical protein
MIDRLAAMCKNTNSCLRIQKIAKVKYWKWMNGVLLQLILEWRIIGFSSYIAIELTYLFYSIVKNLERNWMFCVIIHWVIRLYFLWVGCFRRDCSRLIQQYVLPKEYLCFRTIYNELFRLYQSTANFAAPWNYILSWKNIHWNFKRLS